MIRFVRAIAAAFLPALLVSTTACDLTRVQDPSVITQGGLQNASGAAALRAGALGTLFNAFSSQSFHTGLLADEFTVATQSEVGNLPEDQRVLSLGNPGGFPFGNLSSGRVNALAAIATLRQYAPEPVWHIGELRALSAAVELEFAENLCSGVSLAIVDGSTPSYGPVFNRQQLLTQALEDLDSAATSTTGSDSIAALIAVLRGRAYADSGDFTAAAAAVANVSLGFVYTAELDGATDINAIYNNTIANPIVSVSDREGENGLPFVSAGDPRLPILAVSGSGTTTYADGLVTTGASSLTMASGIEAQLLIAEAALKGGQVSTWSGILNSLRQNAITPAMDTLTSDSTTTASASMQLSVMFRERAFWLFGTGHRQGDLRRLVRQYGLSANSVFPMGPYRGGPAMYGSSVVFPVAGDQYNPNYHGCIDSNA